MIATTKKTLLLGTAKNKNMESHRNNIELFQLIDSIMKQVLTLGQSSLPEHQFLAFRKMVLDYFAEGKRDLGMGWCGDRQTDSKKGGAI